MLPYLIPYILSFLISFSISVVSFRRRQVKGASLFAWSAFSQSLWIFGYIFELTSPTLAGKILWDDFQWLGAFGWMLSLLWFFIAISDFTMDPKKIIRRFLVTITGGFFLILLTNSWHGLVHTNERLIPGEPFSALVYTFTPIAYIYTLITYVIYIYGILFLFRFSRQNHPQLKTQLQIIIIGSAIPIIGILLTLFEITFTFQRDISPITFTIGNIVVAYGLFRKKLFDILPAARQVALDHIPDIIVILNTDNKIIDLNPAAESLAGRSIPEILGRSGEEVFSDWPEITQELPGTDELHKEVYIDRGNRDFHIDLTITTLRNQYNQVEGRLVMTRNITEQKRAEKILQDTNKELERLVEQRTKKLEESEKRYHTLSSAAFEGIAITEAGKIIDVNQQLANILGYQLEELIGIDVSTLVHPEDLEFVQANTAAGEEGPYTHRIIRKNGSILFVEIRGRSQEIDGKATRVTVVRDITEQKRTVEALIESEVLFSKAFHDNPNAMMVVDIENKTILNINHTYTKLSGYEEKEIVNIPGKLGYTLKDQKQLEHVIAAINKSDRAEGIEIVGLAKDGQEFTTLIFAEPLDIQDRHLHILSLVDISERKRLELAEQRALRVAEILEKASSTLSETLDKNTILNTLLDYLQKLVSFDSGAIFSLEEPTLAKMVIVRSRDEWIDTQNPPEIFFDAEKNRLLKTILDTKKGLIVPDTDVHPDWEVTPGGRHIRSWMGVPIVSGNEILGLYSIDHVEPNSFSEEDLRLAEALTSHAAIALRNAELYEQTLKRAVELEKLTKISNTLRYAVSQEDLFALLFEQLNILFEVEASVIFLYDADQLQVIPFEKDFKIYEDINNNGLLIELVNDVIHTSKPLFASKQPVETQFNDNLLSTAFLPLQVSEGNIGVIAFSWKDLDEFSENFQQILSTISDMIGNALDRTRVLETLEQQVADRTRDLTALYEVTAIASAHNELNPIIDNSLEKILEAVNSQTGMIHLINEEKEHYKLITQRGIPENVRDQIDLISIIDSPYTALINRNEPQIISDLPNDERFPEAIRSLDCEVLIGVPIYFGGRTRGILSIFLETSRQFTTDNIRLLNMVIDQMSVALERALLQEQAEKAIVIEERQHLARELHDAVSQSLYSLSLLADAALKFSDKQLWARSEHYLRMVKATAQQVLKEMRLLVFELRPSELERTGFVEAVRNRLETVEKRAGVTFDFIVDNNREPSIDTQVVLYRIVQEALNNALKHAGASLVTITYQSTKDQIDLKITDDGQGFDTKNVRGGIGLNSMKERIEKLGGDLEIISSPGNGCTVHVKLEEQTL